MASLREIKDRIGSVRSTLKITSAMKLVASTKLHRAQQAVADILPYEEELKRMLAIVGGCSSAPAARENVSNKVAVVAVSSNSSLCGAFNANVVREALSLIDRCRSDGEEVEVFPVGRKIAEALKKAGYTCDTDYNNLVARHLFEDSAALARTLAARFNEGEFLRVMLVYNHSVSTSSQKITVETFLGAPEVPDAGTVARSDEYIFEPGAEQIASVLRPLVMNLKIHSVILDSVAAEFAARTVAMQIATDNAQDLLSELTLEYNKGRQQKITSEILDLLGGIA